MGLFAEFFVICVHRDRHVTIVWQGPAEAMHQIALNMRGRHQICPTDNRIDAITVVHRCDQGIRKDRITTPDNTIADIGVELHRLHALYLVIELAAPLDPESQCLFALDHRECGLILTAKTGVNRLACQLFSRASTVIQEPILYELFQAFSVERASFRLADDIVIPGEAVGFQAGLDGVDRAGNDSRRIYVIDAKLPATVMMSGVTVTRQGSDQ